MESFLIYTFELWRACIFPFLVWWMLASGLVIFFAEITHRLFTDKQVAFQAFLWKIAIVVCLLLPFAYYFNSNPIVIPNTLSRLLSVDELTDANLLNQLKGNLQQQWNQNVETQLEQNSKPVGIFENRMEFPSLPTLYRNLPGYQTNSTEPAAASQSSFSTGFYGFLGIFYLPGMLFILLVALVSQYQTRRFLSQTRICHAPHILQCVSELSNQQNLRQKVTVLVCEEKASPSTIGFLNCRLIIPSFMVENWEERELEPILRHELNHFQSSDFLYVHMLSILNFFLWFFPLLYWLRKRTDETREALSDAKAIQYCRAPRDYAQLILKLAEQLTGVPSPNHVYFFTKQGKRVLNRFSRILSFHKETQTACSLSSRCTIGLSMALILVVLSGLRISAFEPKRDISPVGSAVFDFLNDRYRIEGAEEYIAYKKVKGDFSFSARVKMKPEPLRSVSGWVHLFIASEFTSEGTIYGAGVIADSRLSVWHGQLTLNQRNPQGHVRGGYLPAGNQDGWVKLVRKGELLSTYYYNTLIQDWLVHDSIYLQMGDPVYVGIGVWSDDLTQSVVGYFSEVELTTFKEGATNNEP